jgi:hypothetical protein
LDHPISAAIALVLSAWASFTFFRSSITGAPPLYSSGWFAHALHFVAGIIFGSLAIFIALKSSPGIGDDEGRTEKGARGLRGVCPESEISLTAGFLVQSPVAIEKLFLGNFNSKILS